ncbi:MAG: DegT/DnrJ/EryC1/StrS family aminotransferase [Bacteroidota bacterium]
MKNKINIPFYNVERLFRKYSKEIISTVSSVYSSGRVLMGPEIEEFEGKISKMCNRKYALAVGSCTDALYFALLSSGIGKNDEVLVTCFSYIASVTPILMVGAIPVFIDIEPDYFMMDLSDVEAKITGKTKAIIAVNLFGQTLPIDRLEEIAARNGLVLIEDAAQSLGSKYEGNPAGSMGLTSCLSFDPVKIIGAFGAGGVLLTDDETIYRKVKKLRYHGKNMESGTFEILGYNSRIATSQAALISMQLDLLDDWIKKRNEIAAAYDRELSVINDIEIPKSRKGDSHIYHKYVIRVENRDDLRKYLADNGVKTMVHYSEALFEYPLFNNYKYHAENLTVVHNVKNKVISLPIYPELENEEIQYICNVIKKYKAT